MKRIGILGSTGSIGAQSLEIIREFPEKFELVFITANTNILKLIEQINFYKPKYACIGDSNQYQKLQSEVNHVNVKSGHAGLIELCSNKNIDIVINAITGYKGLSLSVHILTTGINLALANKESIVQAGHILNEITKENNTSIFPIDSEHSAIWQSLLGEKKSMIEKIILTGSGGPFRNLNKEDFSKVSKQQALKHPNWNMGNKITIDSATMMNKGFEVIEAFWLFNTPYEKIEIIIHPESIIHSMIQFIDGSIKAQLSEPTMKIPILFALTYPKRYKLPNMSFDFIKNNQLNFEKVDFDKFKCIKLAYEAGKSQGSYTTVLNVANDISVELFLYNKIKFDKIPIIIDACLQEHSNIFKPNLEEIKDTISWTKNYIEEKVIKNV